MVVLSPNVGGNAQENYEYVRQDGGCPIYKVEQNTRRYTGVSILLYNMLGISNFTTHSGTK